MQFEAHSSINDFLDEFSCSSQLTEVEQFNETERYDCSRMEYEVIFSCLQFLLNAASSALVSRRCLTNFEENNYS